MCMYICVCMCVLCLCVCLREREREGLGWVSTFICSTFRQWCSNTFQLHNPNRKTEHINTTSITQKIIRVGCVWRCYIKGNGVGGWGWKVISSRDVMVLAVHPTSEQREREKGERKEERERMSVCRCTKNLPHSQKVLMTLGKEQKNKLTTVQECNYILFYIHDGDQRERERRSVWVGRKGGGGGGGR